MVESEDPSLDTMMAVSPQGVDIGMRVPQMTSMFQRPSGASAAKQRYTANADEEEEKCFDGPFSSQLDTLNPGELRFNKL